MHSAFSKSLFAAGSVAAFVSAAPAQAQAVEQVRIELPAQDLSVSLREVSVRTGRSIIAPSELVRGRQAPAVSGRFTAEEAVRLLIAGGDLSVRRLGDALIISRAASGESPEQGESASASEDTIVVTGTHLRGAPASSPTITIRRTDIDRTGASSVEQLLRRLPQNSQNGVNQENFGAVLPDQDVTDHGAGLNLRGLGQRATLVLLNGRRLAPSGFGSYVDVSLIPVSLVERVEILTDGASAIYGSDAVGGVVNFILRDRLSGLETTAQAGMATRGGGEQWLLSQAAGADWGSGHGLIAYEYRGENEIRARDRSFTINLRPDTFLFPRERRHSVLASLEQGLAEGLTLGITGSYSQRSTDRTYFQSISALPVGAQASADGASIAAELSYEFAGGWRARLEGNYALSSTDQRQTQPGGAELINARDVRNEVMEGALKIDGPLFELPGGPVRLAVGAATRREAYRDGFESRSIARIVDRRTRDVRSLFAELSVPFFTSLNRRPGLERLELSAAARLDDYSQTGSAFDPKVGLLWSPVEGLNLRASYGTSFRAPLLSEIGGDYNVIFLPAFFIYTNPAAAPPGSIAAVLQGSNPDLSPETSRTWSAGAEFEPAFAPGLTLSANYYSIRFANRIALPTRFIVVVGNPAFDSIIDRDPDVAALTRIVAGARLILDATGPGFSNGNAQPADVDIVLDDRVSNTALTTTSGLDFGLRYAFSAGANRFVLEANVSHVLEFDDQLTATSPVSQALNRVYGPLSWRGRGGVGWSREDWAGSLFVNYAGAYQDDRAAVLRPVDNYATVDASLSYAFGPESASWLRGTRISLFAENLLDATPPRLFPEPSSTSGLGYDPVNASGRGRFLSIQIRRSW